MGQLSSKDIVQSMMAAATGQQEPFTLGQASWRRDSAQFDHASHKAPNLNISRNETFGMEFAEGHV